MATSKWNDETVKLTVGNKAANISGITSVVLSTTQTNTRLDSAQTTASTTTQSVTTTVSNNAANTDTASEANFYGGTNGQSSVTASISYTIKYNSEGKYEGTVTDDLQIKNAVASVTAKTTGGTKWASQGCTDIGGFTYTCVNGGEPYAGPTLTNAKLSGQASGVSLSLGKISIATTATLNGTQEFSGTLTWSAGYISSGTKSLTSAKLCSFKNDVTGLSMSGTAKTVWSDAVRTGAGGFTLPSFNTDTTYCRGTGSTAAVEPASAVHSWSNMTTGVSVSNNTGYISSTAKINQSLSVSGTVIFEAGTIAADAVTYSPAIATIKESVATVTIGTQEFWAETGGNAVTLTVNGSTGGTPYKTPTLANASTKPAITNGTGTISSNTYTFTSISGSATMSSKTWIWNDVASVERSAIATLTFKNPVKEVIFDDAKAANQNLYMPAGSTKTMNFSVNPLIAGTPYSYTCTVSCKQGSIDKSSKVSLINATSSAKGSVTFTAAAGDANTNYTIIVSSSQKSGTAVSTKTITLYVSAASQEVYLDWGDKKIITVSNGDSITKYETSTNGTTWTNAAANTTVYSTGVISGSSFTITAKTTGTGYDRYTTSRGSVITVNVTGIDVTLS